MRKALIICSDYPYPMDGGDKISTNAYLLALKNMCIKKIDLMSFDKGIKAGKIDKHGIIDDVFVMHKPNKFSFRNVFDFLFRGKSFLFGRFYSKENVHLIRNVIEENKYDIVIAVQTYVGQLVLNSRPNRNVKYIISTEVLHGRALRKRSEITSNFLKKKFLEIESKRAEKKEKEIVQRYDVSYYYAKEDERSILKEIPSAKTRFVDLALDLKKYPFFPKKKNKNKVLVFYGTCSWFPNEDALQYLLEKIWPLVKSKTENVILRVAGKNMAKWAYKYADERCEIYGMVPDMSEFVKESDIVLAPVRIGGGIRLKILEAMAWGRPIISTQIGMEGNKGIEAVRIANTPEEYCDSILTLLNNDDIWKDCVVKGRNYVENNHSVQLLANKIREDLCI